MVAERTCGETKSRGADVLKDVRIEKQSVGLPRHSVFLTSSSIWITILMKSDKTGRIGFFVSSKIDWL
jgi:hypothetical protein